MTTTPTMRFLGVSTPGIRRRWTTAFVVGELIGFIPPAIVGATLAMREVGDLVLVAALTAAGALEGVALGVAQHAVLGARWPQIARSRWVTATAAAAALAWLVGMGGSAVASNGDGPGVVAIVVLAPLMLLALLSMGFFQWLVLRPAIPGCARWTFVTAGAWLVGVAVPVVALSIVPNGWPAAAHVVVGVFAAVGMGIVVGSLTGGMVQRMAEAEEPSPGTGRPSAAATGGPSSRVLAIRFGWTALSCFVVESIIVGLAALPAVAFYQWHLDLSFDPYPLRIFLLAAALLPAYMLFAVLLMTLSAEATRLLGWRPPPAGDLVIAELPIELRNWARYAVINHIVHVVAGVVFRSTPVWIWYMRRNGAKIGRHVWVNSLQVGDDCLLDFGDEVVIGAGVHLSAHTVERGRLRLAPIKLGAGTTIGVGTHVGIGVTTGEHTQVGSMSVVPKNASLKPHTTYVGIPARAVDPSSSGESTVTSDS